MINDLAISSGYVSYNKYKEELCGDRVEIIKPNDDLVVMVLADGLGSGVKANILSTLTSKTLATLLANNVPTSECVRTLANILPICKVRGVAYSTFTGIKIVGNEIAEIIEYDNPKVIILRNGKEVLLDRISNKIDGKKIYTSTFRIQLGDILIAMSDGAIHAGIGSCLNFGWERENIVKYIESKYIKSLSAKNVSSIIANKCNELYENMPGDDTTISTIKVIKRTSVNLVIGPPEQKGDDRKMMNLFFSKSGHHIVCGGTTAGIVSRYLNKPVNTELNLKELDKEIPPISSIEGVDLVTEGVITINTVLKNCDDYLADNLRYSHWTQGNDGASLLTRILIEEATDICFFVGKAVNPAHQNPDLKIGFNIKMKLVEAISKDLEKMGKKIVVSYF